MVEPMTKFKIAASNADVTSSASTELGIEKNNCLYVNTEVCNETVLLRIIVVILISGLIAGIGGTSYIFLNQMQSNEFQSVFKSSVNQISKTLDKNLNDKFLAAEIVDSIYGYAQQGTANKFPNFTLPGYASIIGTLAQLSSARVITFDPIVAKENRKGWEAYAAAHVGELNGPSLLEVSTNGSWVVADGIYTRDSTGRPVSSPGHLAGSTYPDILVPIWQTTVMANGGAIMYDVHSINSTGLVIDKVISTKKAGFTDIYQLVIDKEPRPSTILYGPVKDISDGRVVGISASIHSWDTLLQDALPEHISGITLVLQSDTKTFTFLMSDGKISLLGEGDMHDGRFNRYRTFITESVTSLSASSATSFILTVYPTRELFNKYVTILPVAVSTSFVAAIVFTAVLIMLHSYYMMKREKALLLKIMEQQSQVSLGNLAMRELDMKKSFVRYVSHEVRNPLNIVALGLTHLMSEIQKRASYETLANIVNEIESANALAVGIMDNLLVYEKLNSNVLDLHMSQVSVKDFLLETLRPLNLQTISAGVSLTLVCTERSLDLDSRIEIDESKISRILRNVVMNAIRFSKRGGEVTVNISVVHRNEQDTVRMLRLDVVDQGQGISKENQRRLFKEIVQFNPGELQDGNGSGLSLLISHQIITKHKGRLSMHSEGLGKGSTFTIELPLYVANERIAGGEDFFRDSPETSALGSFRNDASSAVNLPALIASETFKLTLSSKSNASSDSLNNVSSAQRTRSPLAIDKAEKDYFKYEAPSPVKSNSLGAANNNIRVYPFDNKENNVSERKGEDDKDRLTYIDLCPSIDHDEFIMSQTGRKRGVSDRNYSISDCSSTGPTVLLGARVLIVDDVAMNRKMMVRIILDRWSNVNESVDGLTAVEAVKQAQQESQPYDLILMDYQMPNMNGPEAAKLIRESGYNGFIVGVTGNGLPQDVEHFLTLGADRVLLKPLKIAALDECLEALVEAREGRHPLRSPSLNK